MKVRVAVKNRMTRSASGEWFLLFQCIAIAGGILASIPSTAAAQESLPHTFQPDTTAYASEVNENFEYLNRRGNSFNPYTYGLFLPSVRASATVECRRLQAGGNLTNGGPQDGSISLQTAAGVESLLMRGGRVELCSPASGCTTGGRIDMKADPGFSYVEMRRGDGEVGIYLQAGANAGQTYIEVNGEEVADYADFFPLSEGPDIQPGMVVVIDPNNAGRLRLSDSAYDRKAAGIISGAGGLRAGLKIGGKDPSNGGKPVAVSGRVYAYADASTTPIEAGDLLTTSSTPGHAMKVVDREAAIGAVVGKAMTPLPSGQGLVLVLVTLQ